MGTVFTIYLYDDDPQQATACLEAAFQEIERLEEALSNYRSSSELSRINRLAQNNQRPQADEQAGWAAGVAVALGNQAIDQRRRILFRDHVARQGGG